MGESLMLRYKADQSLPLNTISRFIIRHNEQIIKVKSGYLVWRSGVILQDTNGCIALVREEDRTIKVSVKGHNKTNFISDLRETLNDIFNSYKSKKPELQYQIKEFGEISQQIETKNPIWLPDRKILTHTLDNVPYYDENTRQQMFLNSTVNIYNITAQTLISGSDNQIIDSSIHKTFNFQNSNIDLQGNLNDLKDLLIETGNEIEAQKIENVAKALEQVEQSPKDQVKKKGIGNKLNRLIQDLGNKNSDLHKTVDGLKSGIDIVKTIVEPCVKIIQWLG